MYILPRIDGFVNPPWFFSFSREEKIVKERCFSLKILDIMGKIHYNYYVWFIIKFI